jgi:N-acetylmuramoyl-L-alanine amidase
MNNFKIIFSAVVFTISILYISATANISAVKLPDGSQMELESRQSDGETFVKAASLAQLLDGVESIDFLSKSGRIDFDKFDIEYSLFSPYIKSGDNIYNLYKPVEFHDGSFYLPIRYLAMALNLISDQSFTWDGKSLKVAPPKFNVIGLNASQKMNGLLIEIYMKDNLKYDAVKTDDNWIVVTIADGKVDSQAFNHPISAKAVYEIKTYQFENSCQVSVKLRPRDFTFVSKVKEDPLRIQILVRGEGFSDSTMMAEAQSNESMSDNPIDIIVIDPGHGGDDKGAVGAKGIKEKEVTLKIAKHLYDLLKADGRFKPMMTRQDDIFVPLAQRTILANSVGGDLFISIHANAANSKKAFGLIAFTLADAKTDQARVTATLENSSIKFEKLEEQEQYNTDLDFTLRDMVQSEYQRESIDLADMMQKNVALQADIASRGIDQAGFFVLDKAYMPAVLLETGFITNSKDEKKLISDDFQMKTAKAIYDSIVEFKEKYDRQ